MRKTTSFLQKANARVNLDAGLVGMTPQPIDLKEAKSGQHRFFEAMFVGEKSILMPLKINTILYSAKAIPPFVHRTISWKFYQTVQASNWFEKLADRLGILPEEIMAMGDANNDLEMIEFAGLGIAMGNANEQVKAIAKDITDTNENNGVAKAIENIF